MRHDCAHYLVEELYIYNVQYNSCRNYKYCTVLPRLHERAWQFRIHDAVCRLNAGASRAREWIIMKIRYAWAVARPLYSVHARKPPSASPPSAISTHLAAPTTAHARHGMRSLRAARCMHPWLAHTQHGSSLLLQSVSARSGLQLNGCRSARRSSRRSSRRSARPFSSAAAFAHGAW